VSDTSDSNPPAAEDQEAAPPAQPAPSDETAAAPKKSEAAELLAPKREEPTAPPPAGKHGEIDPSRDGEEPELLPPAEDAHESRTARWWDAGGEYLSYAYWGSLAVFFVALFRSRTLPFVDYPQHLALAATLKRMFAGGAAERALYDTNLLSFNSLFHLLVAALNFALPIDTAGKLVIGLYLFALGYGGIQLARATGRPRARAFFVMPVAFGYTMAWGFVNFSLGAAIGLVVMARTLVRLIDHPDNAPRTDEAKIRYDVITAVLATLGAYTHLLATALGYMLMLAAIVAHVQTSRRSLGTRLGHATRVGLPLLPAVAYCFVIYKRQMAQSFQNFEYSSSEGNDMFGLVKLKGFLEVTTGLRADRLDENLLGLLLVLLLVSAMFRDLEDDAENPPLLRWMVVTAALAYFVIPHVFWATNFVFERVGFFVVILAAMWAPRATARVEEPLRLMFAFTGLVLALSFWRWMGLVASETADFDAIIAEAPKNRKITGLIWNPAIDSTGKSQKFHLIASLLHSPAYYVARNGGEVAFSFTRTMSLPVHYRKETMPPDPPPNFEWNPSDYRPNADYAKYFDLVLMKTTNDDGVDPRPSVWGRHASEVDTVAHHGRWWIFETKRVTADPPEALERPELPDLPEAWVPGAADDAPAPSPSAP
jgi:hypothetical protein